MEIVCGHLTSHGPAAIFPGSFHPPTVAHLALAHAALSRVETVVFALPRAFPHKQYEFVSQAERLDVLSRLAASEQRFAVAITDGGLFVEMARELRQLRPSAENVFVLCGRDAAERIIDWPYPPHDPLVRQFDDFSLLVAARQGAFEPPPRFRHRVQSLPVESTRNDVSSSQVRDAIRDGADWHALVPPHIHDLVAALYSPSRLDSKNVRSR